MPLEGEELSAHISRKYGSTTEESKQNAARISSIGAELGFAFNFFDGMRIVNIRGARVLLEFGREPGRQTESKLRLFDAYCNGHMDVSDRETPIVEVEYLGLSAADARLALDSVVAQHTVEATDQ